MPYIVFGFDCSRDPCDIRRGLHMAWLSSLALNVAIVAILPSACKVLVSASFLASSLINTHHRSKQLAFLAERLEYLALEKNA